MKEFRRDFRRRMNRSCRPDAVPSRTRGRKGSTKLLPSEEDATREAYGPGRGIRNGIIPVRFPGKFPGIFPVFIPETDFLFSPRFRRACRVRIYSEYKRMFSMGKPVRNLFTNFSGFSFPKVSRSSVTELTAVSDSNRRRKSRRKSFTENSIPIGYRDVSRFLGTGTT